MTYSVYTYHDKSLFHCLRTFTPHTFFLSPKYLWKIISATKHEKQKAALPSVDKPHRLSFNSDVETAKLNSCETIHLLFRAFSACFLPRIIYRPGLSTWLKNIFCRPPAATGYYLLLLPSSRPSGSIGCRIFIELAFAAIDLPKNSKDE